MIVLVSVTVGLVIWLTLWAFGVKAFDAFLIPFLLGFVAAAVQLALPYVRRLRTGEHPGAPEA